MCHTNASDVSCVLIYGWGSQTRESCVQLLGLSPQLTPLPPRDASEAPHSPLAPLSGVSVYQKPQTQCFLVT